MIARPSFVVAAILLASCQTATPAGPKPTVRSISGATMGTRYHVSVVGNDATDLTEVQQEVDALLAEINRQMSTYDRESELSRFNASERSDSWFPVSASTAKVVAAALEIAEQTGGAFDPTVGPAVDLWGFGPAGRRRKRPSDARIAAVLERIGYQRVEVRARPPALKKEAPDVRLDLSAIAKGFAVDEVSGLLAKLGYENTMVEIGGEVRARGRKAGGRPWRIGVERPTPRGRVIDAIVELDGAMASSGDYRNFFEEGGKRYSHTIDPQTARPVTHDLATVTVCRPRCMEADALATALLVMGPKAGYDWCKKRDVAALFQIRGAGEAIKQKSTPQFRRLAVAKE